LSDPKSKIKREFLFTRDDFLFIKDLVYKESGISLSDVKQDMVYSRLAKRLRILGFKTFSEYCRYLNSNYDKELSNTINAITTNLTHFYREIHHFETLKDTILPEILTNKPNGNRIRIWSAGCSTGEEPYSTAMTILDTIASISQWDIKILATDLDTNVIEHSKQGLYENRRIEPVEDRLVKKWFKQVGDSNKVIINDSVKDLITFNQLNLMNEWPFKGPFDVIFCRNVVIYFDKPTQQKLFKRFYDLLAPGGYLFLGHSEQLGDAQKNYDVLGKTTFRKK